MYLLEAIRAEIHHRGQAHAMLAGTAVKPPQLDEYRVVGEARPRRNLLHSLDSRMHPIAVPTVVLLAAGCTSHRDRTASPRSLPEQQEHAPVQNAKLPLDPRRFCDGVVHTEGNLSQDTAELAAEAFREAQSTDAPPAYPLVRQPADIQAIIREQYPVFRTCYEQALARDPLARGMVITRFVIQPGGAVTDACLKASALADREAVACMLDGYAQLSFPVAVRKITVIYPIQFDPD